MMKTVLVITNKDDITVDFVIKELQKRGITYYRLNTEDIPNKIYVNFNINTATYELFDGIKQITINLLEFDSVYYRRPLLNNLYYIDGINMQERNYLRSELAFVLEGIYKILKDKFWLNNIYDIREAENKIYQLQLAQEVGFLVPQSLISNQIGKVNQFKTSIGDECIVKPIKSGNVNGESTPKAIFTTKINDEHFEDIERIEAFPIYIQNNIHKQYDLRIIVIGTEIYAAQIHSQVSKSSEIDWRKGSDILEHRVHNLPENIKKMCIELTKRLNLNYSAIDMVVDRQGQYVFLEINPNGQWAWIENRLGFPLAEKIVDLLIVEDNSNVF